MPYTIGELLANTFAGKSTPRPFDVVNCYGCGRRFYRCFLERGHGLCPECLVKMEKEQEDWDRRHER